MSTEVSELAEEASRGDRRLFSKLLADHRLRLRRVIDLRMDRRLQGRIDPSDVVQEAYLEASTRLPEFLHNPNLPFFLWLRLITLQKLAQLHRRHLATQARNVSREVMLFHSGLPEAPSSVLAADFLARLSSPSDVAIQAEQKLRLQQAIDQLDPIDREVLVLRHFEELSNQETAQVLDLRPTAASNRYVRALQRLQDRLDETTGGREEFT